MFTGLVADLGTVAALERDGGGARLRISTPLASELAEGDSIAVNGACLTAVAIGDGEFAADVMNQTLKLTSLGPLGEGDRVNLELALRAADRMGGHVVQGHVDGVGEIVDLSPLPDGSTRMRCWLPAHLMRYVVEKGSITVDGISLTVVEARADGFTVAVIPHTAAVTTLGTKGPGDPVNLEVDVMAKYAEKLLSGHLGSPGGPSREERVP